MSIFKTRSYPPWQGSELLTVHDSVSGRDAALFTGSEVCIGWSLDELTNGQPLTDQ